MAKSTARQPSAQNGSSSKSSSSGAAKKFKMLVRPDRVGRIIGRGGSTISRIKTKSGAKIDVTDELEDNLKVVHISGSESQVEVAVRMLRELLVPPSTVKLDDQNGGGPPEHTDECDVPEYMGGLIIGVRGATIRHIQDRTGAAVKVGSKDSASGGFIKVKLGGTKDSCEDAKKIIMDMIAEAPITDSQQDSSNSETLEIPLGKIRAVIGLGGATVREIEEESGAKVDVGRRDSAVNGMVTVKLTGAEEVRAIAKERINNVISKEEEPQETVEEWVEAGLIGLLIGYRGSKIKEIQMDSGANVRADRRENAVDGKVLVTITGSKDQVERARTLVTEATTPDPEPTERGNESGAREPGSGGEEPHTIVMWVASSRCGVVIGARGYKINEIQSKTNTRIDVNSKEMNDNDECQIRITGDKDGCENAKAEIDRIVSEVEGNDYDQNERGTLDLWVPCSALGKIFGKGGTAIRETENRFKIKIDVKKDIVEQDETKVVLIGYRNPVESARDYINSLIEE